MFPIMISAGRLRLVVTLRPSLLAFVVYCQTGRLMARAAVGPVHAFVFRREHTIH